jgi:hypothetical protein
MGAGQFPAAYRYGDLAGLDPVFPPAPRVVKSPPVALEFDPGARAYVMNADGTMASIDTVDAQVALLLGIEFGSVPSAATFGNKLRKVLARVAPSKQVTVATQEVARVLGPLITAGSVALVSVAVDNTYAKLGAVKIAVTYLNLTLLDAEGNPTEQTVEL